MHLRLAFLAAAVLPALPAAVPASGQAYALPTFAEAPAARRARIDAAREKIDAAFREVAKQRNYPGLVWGIVLDGELVHTGATGFGNLERRIPAAADTRFRIASMSKSFTALAVLKLRDAGRLSLSDPVEKFLPEFRAVRPLTADAGPITVRHLLTMTPGFPEDNPWGDRQLAIGVKEFASFLTDGLSLSNPPGVAFEYSNLAYALLGQIIGQASGEPYQRYITREILRPLGLRDTVWEYTDVPADKLALGYRRVNNAWQPEPLLHDGVYGAMGGLITTVNDFARYVTFHLAAWPPRDDPDNGIVRRATIREMHQPAVITNFAANARNRAGEPAPFVGAYGYGLGTTLFGDGVVFVGHSGGLPGFGSNYRFYPHHGFGILSFANLTYAGTSAANGRVGEILINEARLLARASRPSAILAARARQVAELVQAWDPKLADAIVAENFFLDRSREEWMKRARAILDQAGAITGVEELEPENQLRGTFHLLGPKGRVKVFFTLTPEKSPRVQEVRLTFVPPP